MAKTLVVVLTCDRCAAEGKEEAAGTDSVSFAFDGFNYNLDLCAPHAEEFHNTVQSMISWASERTRVSGQRRGRKTFVSDAAAGEPSLARPTADREHLKAIREWARKNGHPDLSDRGRIPQAVMTEYEVANPTHRG